MNKTLKIGNKQVGNNCPCYVIAEIGSNHNQDYQLAIETIDAAVEAGVDAVKFQTFKAKHHYSKFTPNFKYLDNINVYELIESLELNREWQDKLNNYCKNKNIEFLTSPCDIDAIEICEKLDLAAYKVASFDITDQSLIKKMADTGKPVILSTGMADLIDLYTALETINKSGNDNTILLQCTSLYPAPVNLSNLRAIQTMKGTFGCLTGYSDHTEGHQIVLAAVTLGACMIEKHFTLDRTMPGPDHKFAIEPEELKSMVNQIRDIESAIGDGLKNGPREEEMDMFVKGRRSLHASRDISKGEIISEDMLKIKRPGLGISPLYFTQILGREVKEDIPEDLWITWDKI